MTNQLGQFSPHLAQLSQLLRELLGKNVLWISDDAQGKTLNLIKAELAKPTVLALYDVNADLKIFANASSYGLGAVLLQKNDQSWQPVVYASCVMTSTECRYAQVEKEALAITWPCEKFTSYIISKKFNIEPMTSLWSH